MKVSTVKSVSIAFASLILILGFQNCSKTSFSPADEGSATLKSTGTEVLAETPPAPEDVVPGNDPTLEEEIEDAKSGVVCIGNGIKVPVSDVVNCADGSPKCVNLCSKAAKVVASFKSARDLIKQGATTGVCP